SSAAVGARRAPEAARVDAPPSPGPPSILGDEDSSSIALVPMVGGSLDCGWGI
ncbi:hypothetical protein THAOC_23236, partial [Thalassiosira oceanica]